MVTKKRRDDLAVTRALKKVREARVALAEVNNLVHTVEGDNDLAMMEARLEALLKLRNVKVPEKPAVPSYKDPDYDPLDDFNNVGSRHHY